MPTPRKSQGEMALDTKSNKRPAITVPDATDLASAITLLNAIKATINQMNAPETQ